MLTNVTRAGCVCCILPAPFNCNAAQNTESQRRSEQSAVLLSLFESDELSEQIELPSSSAVIMISGTSCALVTSGNEALDRIVRVVLWDATADIGLADTGVLHLKAGDGIRTSGALF
ncbi:hypothetical protein MAR_030672 [Mya arenaria]|uniref:Uncharacterized protein n=1 Tax=Mya arenaria TaxID=6604 RepID=A0ABY7F1L6_MYAAR|nr:hypothetical protein MAR_030672 [Mya arenaria]